MIQQGLGVSPGIVIGKAYLLDRKQIEINTYTLKENQIATEISRFHQALAISKDQLSQLKIKLAESLGSEHLYIIDTHLMLLDDDMLVSDTVKGISENKINAEWALKRALENFVSIFESMNDEYLKERRTDVLQVGNRVLYNLIGKRIDSFSQLDRPVILVAHDLAPSDTLQMNKERVLGFATDLGGRTSHTAIMARSLEIPAVIGLKHITQEVITGDTLLLDGSEGLVVINPSQEQLAYYLDKQQKFQSFRKELYKLKDLPAETRDGYKITLAANIEYSDEINSVKEHGVEGVGLYRTEYLYLNRVTLPTPEEHFLDYRKVAEGVFPYPAIIRTLDLGGDKFYSPLSLAEEINPALGLRAIRFCLNRVDIFKNQLKGILMASHFGKLKIMYPMISGMEELRMANAILEEVKKELQSKGTPFDHQIQVGVTIETPGAAIIADMLAQETDFFSIGTNDLIQYALAIDRINEQVAYLYQPMHPAILRLIRYIVKAGHRHGIRVAICGVMASDPLNVILLLGLGVDELSMDPPSVQRIKRIIRSIKLEEAGQFTEKALSFTTASEVKDYILDVIKKRFPQLLDLEMLKND